MPAATSVEASYISAEETASEQVFLVRVRRRPEAEPLEALELSFDGANQLKRKRLVTQSDALATQFDNSMSI